MAKSTYLELCQQVRQECGIPGSGPSAVTAQSGILLRVTDWVADAAMELESLWRDWGFRWSQYSTPSIINTSDYNGPDDLGAWDTESIYLDYGTATSKGLRVLDYKEFRDGLGRGATTASKPSYAVVLPSNVLRLHPKPDVDTYTLTADYFVKPTRLAANTDTSLIPEQFERIIVARAKLGYAGEEGAQVLMQQASSEYGYLLQQLEADQLPRRQGSTTAEFTDVVVHPI